jgi:hypothetical protein
MCRIYFILKPKFVIGMINKLKGCEAHKYCESNTDYQCKE